LAIGYNYRDKICTNTYEEAVVYIDSADGKYTLDEDGKAVVVVKHDAYMIGKRIMLMVNMTGLNPNNNQVLRSGEVHETTLRFHKPLIGATFSVGKGETKTVTLLGTIDTGVDTDRWALINSNFSCKVKKDNVNILSFSENNVTDCNTPRAFLQYTITTVDNNKEGSLTLSECTPDDEDPVRF
jgi:hypothetical protein